jgi:hypothetical protein
MIRTCTTTVSPVSPVFAATLVATGVDVGRTGVEVGFLVTRGHGVEVG